jgi:Bacterial PH domain
MPTTPRIGSAERGCEHGRVGMNPVQFRRSPALTVAAVVVAITVLFVVTSPYLVSLLIVPLGVAVWSRVSGTDADESGLTVRAALGRRRIPWSDIAGFVVERRGQVSAQLTSGRAMTLPAVAAEDVPRLVAASGQQLGADGDVTGPR